MTIFKDTLIIFSGRASIVVAGIITSVIIARFLGPVGQGIYTLIVLFPFLLAKIGDLGIGYSNVYFQGKKQYPLENIVANSFSMAVIMGAFSLGIGLLLFHFFHFTLFKGIPKQPLFIALLMIPAFFFLSYFGMILIGANKISEYNLTANILRSSLWIIFSLLFLVILRFGLTGAVLSWVLTNLIAGIAAFYFVHRIVPIKWSIDLKLCKKFVKFGIKAYLITIMNHLNYRMNLFLVNLFMGTIFVGYFSIAVLSAESLLYFSGSVGLALFPKVAQASENFPYNSTPQACRISFFLTFLGALFLLALGKIIIILLFGNRFLPAYGPLKILLPGIVVLSISRVLVPYLIGRGKPIIVTYASGISLGINIILNFLFIPKWGISGAAFASTFSYIIASAIILKMFLKISKSGLLDTIIIKRADFIVLWNKWVYLTDKVNRNLLG